MKKLLQLDLLYKPGKVSVACHAIEAVTDEAGADDPTSASAIYTNGGQTFFVKQSREQIVAAMKHGQD